MLKKLREGIPFLPARWIELTQKYAAGLVIVVLFATAGVLAYAVINFKINTDLTDMVSNKLPFRKTYKAFRAAFPNLSDTIVIVIEADSPELAQHTQKLLSERLFHKKEVFKSVYLPEGGNFFEENGLLYLSLEELEDLTDKLAEFQPLLAMLSRDLSLRGLFSILEKIVKQPEEIVCCNKQVLELFDRLSLVFERALENRLYAFSWQEMMSGRMTENLRRIIVVQPVLDYSLLFPGKIAIDTIHRLSDDILLKYADRVEVHLTGEVVLSNDDLMSVQQGIGFAATISFILVGIVLFIGLSSVRHVTTSLLILLIGLIWTLGFALAFIGSLNMISIAFAVLFIGIGVDYSIQYALRYREFIESGCVHSEALSNATKGVCNAFFLCTLTTAIGFYAFVPTAYAGASELGIIAGTGMFINLFVHLSVFPALLKFLPIRKKVRLSFSLSSRLSNLPDRFARTITVAAIILTGASLTLLPRVMFDFNPLNLSNPAAESVVTARDLFKNGKTSPWTISVVAADRQAAKVLAKRLEELNTVEMALTITDFVPDKQDEKLEMISDIALFMPQDSQEGIEPPPDFVEKVGALSLFEKALKESVLSYPEKESDYGAIFHRLYRSIERFNRFVENPVQGQPAVKMLENALLENLEFLMDNLKKLVAPARVTLANLPRELTQRYISSDGRYRIQVFPHANIADVGALKQFVSDVRFISPDATAAPVTILESGRAIVSAFKRATIYALVAISTLLLLIFRRLSEVILTLLPLLLAILLTVAASVLMDIPFNFANVIVVPLLLGIGLDYSIHLVYRYRFEASSNPAILETSTSRGVFFSALTTIMSFGSLSFITHKGTASMGKLLTICILFMLMCVLIVLPSLLRLHRRYLERKQ